MMLTSLFRRDHLLITLAAMAGLLAQEVLTRTTTTDADSPLEFSKSAPLWGSVEAFYAGDARAQAAFAVRQSEPSGEALAISLPEGPRLEAGWSDEDPEDKEGATWVTSGGRESEERLPAVEAAPALVADTRRPAVQESVSEPPAAEELPPPIEDRGERVEEETGEPLVESPLDTDQLPAAETGSQLAKTPAAHEALELTPQQLRQQRAMERANARRARLEAYRDMGYCPSRPVVSASGRDISQPPAREVVIVPVLVAPSAPSCSYQVR